MKKILLELLRCEDGASLVKYLLVAGLIALTSILTIIAAGS